MVLFIDERAKMLWDTWNIRGLIILSLLLQSFLILVAPFRKQMGGQKVVMISTWVAYLLADWVATFTVGLIFHADRSDILTLWAPFLLLHLGGPDTITSFSLEDNEFWIRHLFGLMIQCCATVFVMLQSIRQNKLLLPTLLVFVVGVIKYAERNIAFYHASFDHYGDKIPNVSSLEETATTEPDTENRYLGAMLRKELAPYGTIKNLLVGPLLSPDRRNLNRRFFLERESNDALSMMEIELSLLYEALYTKLPVVHCKIGYGFRVISLGCTFGALMSFMSITKHYEFGKFDIWLTYGLLISAMALEFTSIVFLVFSDFNFLGYYRWVDNPELRILVWNEEFENMSSQVRNRRRIIKLKVQNLGDQEWDFIFCELRRKARGASTVEKGKKLCVQRGDGILCGNENHGNENRGNENHGSRYPIWSVKELDYTESLLTWHIATEFCYQFDKKNPAPDDMDYREISKSLSDYMFYLLEMQPAMMATVSIDRKEVCKRAYHDIKSVFRRKSNLDVQSLTAIFSNEPKPVVRTRGERISVVLAARKLAYELQDQNGTFPWELMSKVWVELMCYAAINCRPNVHAQQPSKGGQLLTFVWLLMNHLGLGTQFSTEQVSFANGTEREEDQP